MCITNASLNHNVYHKCLFESQSIPQLPVLVTMYLTNASLKHNLSRKCLFQSNTYVYTYIQLHVQIGAPSHVYVHRQVYPTTNCFIYISNRADAAHHDPLSYKRDL